MSYLLRLVLPDRPGSLGAVATAIGSVGGDIVSLDVVERGPGGAIDDVIVDFPRGGLADSIISAAESVEGVSVESLRPYLGGLEIHRDLELVDELAEQPELGLELLVEHAPGVFRAGWALLVETGPEGVKVLHSSAGSPDPAALRFPWLPLPTARRMEMDEEWVPERWEVLGMEMAAAPVGHEHRAVLLGRPGGPPFRPSEVLRLAHLAGIAAMVAKAPAPCDGDTRPVSAGP